MQAVKTIGLDIAKSVFQVHGIDAEDNVIIRRQLKRRYVLAFFQKMPPCIGRSSAISRKMSAKRFFGMAASAKRRRYGALSHRCPRGDQRRDGSRPAVEYGRAGANGELRKHGRALDASQRTCLFRVMSNVLLRAFVIAAALCGLAAPALARVEIFVDLSRQRMTVKKPGGNALVWKVSSGRSGFETPTGVFNVQRMDAEHFSDEYEQAPMPYAIFFSRGLAIHGSYERGLGHPVSHGCIRLSVQNARDLYSWVEQYGATIEIAGSADEMIAQDDESYGRQRRARKQRVFTVWPP